MVEIVDTDKDIFFHQYTQTLFQQYGFHSKVEQYHQTSGRGDFNQNFSILSYNEQLSSSSQYEAYPS